MGLDIYVRWDNITKEEHDAQITGFMDAPEAGYLRYNWTGVSVMEQLALRFNFTNPIEGTFQNWEGYNGEDYPVTKDKLEQLLAYQARLEGWLTEHPAGERRDEDWEWFRHEIENWVKFIDFIHSKIDQPGLTVIYG